MWTGLLLLLLSCLCVCACGREAAVPPAPRVLGWAPWFQLTDQTGKRFESGDLLGRVWIANFMFTRCRGTCPLQASRTWALQAKRREHPAWSDLRFISFSVDPEHDTEEVLAEYARENGADDAIWHFLTGERQTIWKISAQGFKLYTGENPEDEAMPIAHSASFVLVDRRGLIRGYFDSQTDAGMADLETALKSVLAEPAPGNQPDPSTFRDARLEKRAAAQREAAKDYDTFHDFLFEDRCAESGIRFMQRCVDDSGLTYKAVHYDHGNGVAVADVDGDGRLDIYFSNQVGSNQLWRNLGDSRFEDITEEAGVAVRDPVGVTASFADTDNDGDPDLFVTTVRGGNYFFVNDGKGHFRDATKDSGLAYSGHSSAGVFFDFDRDGLLDLFLCNVGVFTTEKVVEVANDWTATGMEQGTFRNFEGMRDAFSGHLKPGRGETSILYRNLGENRFENVTRKMGLSDSSWTGDATPLDANGDGWVDLYVLDMQGHDEYFENNKGLSFSRRSREVFPRTPWGSMGVKSFDQDNDGDFDLFITDMHSDMSQKVEPEQEKQKSEMIWPESLLLSEGRSIFGNAFFRNDGAGTFVETSAAVGAENYWPWGLSVGDLNADGFEDVFIASSMNYRFRYAVNSVLLNEKGRRFVDSEFVLGVEPRRGALGKPWFVLDCSGADADCSECEGHTGELVLWSPLGSRSSVLFDLDGDGDLDIVTNEFNSEPQVLVNGLSESRAVRWLSVKLVGTKSNRDGLGAVVTVTAGGKRYTKCHDGQSGYLSQSSKPLYFGLGDAASVSSIEVRWPSGITQTIAGPLDPNRQLELREK